MIANIKKAERDERITGIKIARASPTISHLLFADDSLFFCKAEAEKCQTVFEVIGKYGRALGQEINFNQTKNHLKGLIGITKEGGMNNYLGIPESLGGSKCKIFNYVRERLNDRINGW